MSRSDFEYWVGVLRQNFPDHPNLSTLGNSWYADGGNGWVRSRISRLWRGLVRQTRMAAAKKLLAVYRRSFQAF